MKLEIFLARPEHLDVLPEIERQAAQLFKGWDVPDCVIEDATAAEEFVALQQEGLLWIALLNEKPVGFAVVEPEDDALHLEELDVHPQYGRQGIGSAIVNALCDWAANHGYRAVTLTTYSDIPWNAPFYQKLGFRVIPHEQLNESLRQHVAKEAARGLETLRRVVMKKSLAHDK